MSGPKREIHHAILSRRLRPVSRRQRRFFILMRLLSPALLARAGPILCCEFLPAASDKPAAGTRRSPRPVPTPTVRAGQTVSTDRARPTFLQAVGRRRHASDRHRRHHRGPAYPPTPTSSATSQAVQATVRRQDPPPSNRLRTVSIRRAQARRRIVFRHPPPGARQRAARHQGRRVGLRHPTGGMSLSIRGTCA